MFGSSNMLWHGQSLSLLHSNRMGILVELMNEGCLDNFGLMDSSCGGRRGGCRGWDSRWGRHRLIRGTGGARFAG
jgi:hypothetical protein